jgi:hypothetical protein
MPPEGAGVELPGGVSLRWEAGDSGVPAWHLDGDVDWKAYKSLQVISAGIEGDTLTLAALRPAEAEGHDADLLAVGFTRAEDDEPAAVDNALLSVERGPDGSMRRIGIELWLGDGTALRVAGNRESEGSEVEEGGVRRESTPLSVRLEGREGSGVHDLVTPA